MFVEFVRPPPVGAAVLGICACVVLLEALAWVVARRPGRDRPWADAVAARLGEAVRHIRGTPGLVWGLVGASVLGAFVWLLGGRSYVDPAWSLVLVFLDHPNAIEFAIWRHRSSGALMPIGDLELYGLWVGLPGLVVGLAILVVLCRGLRARDGWEGRWPRAARVALAFFLFGSLAQQAALWWLLPELGAPGYLLRASAVCGPVVVGSIWVFVAAWVCESRGERVKWRRVAEAATRIAPPLIAVMALSFHLVHMYPWLALWLMTPGWHVSLTYLALRLVPFALPVALAGLSPEGSLTGAVRSGVRLIYERRFKVILFAVRYLALMLVAVWLVLRLVPESLRPDCILPGRFHVIWAALGLFAQNAAMVVMVAVAVMAYRAIAEEGRKAASKAPSGRVPSPLRQIWKARPDARVSVQERRGEQG